MSDNFKSGIELVVRATGAVETRTQIDTITKSFMQLAKEDALYAQKQAQYSRQREANLRREAAAAQKLAQEMAKAEEKALARRSVFGVDTGVDIKNFAAGLYTVQAAYRAVAQAAGIAMDAVNEAAKWQKYEVAITTMEGSATVAKQSLQDLYEIAKAPGIDLEGANKSYLQLRAIGIEGERAKTIISEFANTVARSGGGGVEFERVNRQLVQMLANGRVLESELKWMKESMPELAKVMQATFGTTSAEGIRKLGISADEFVRRLTGALAELPRAQATLTTEIENTTVAWSRLQAAFVNTSAVTTALRAVTTQLETITALLSENKVSGAWKVILSLAAGRAGGSGADVMRLGELGPQAAQLQLKKEKYGRLLSGTSRYTSMWNAVTGTTRQDEIEDLRAEFAVQNMNQQIEADRARMAALNVPAKTVTEEKKKARQQREPRNNDLSYYELEGKKLLAVQEKLEDMRQKDVDAANAADRRAREKQAEEKKAALEEAADIMRTEQEREYEEARVWREKALAAVGEGLAERRRVEEAHGKKLADINDKYNKQIAEEEKKQQKERLDAMESFTSGMGSLAGAMGGLIIQMNEQNTEAYAAMVAIQQGFAIAQATMNMWVAMSNALTQPYPLNIAAMGQVAAAGGQIISAITAMNVAKVGKGFFDRGGSLGYGEWGIVGERGPEIVEGPARITSRRATAAMMNSSAGATGTVVNVHNYAGASVATKTNTDGSIDLIIDKLEERMAEGVYAGSSKLGTAMTRSFGLRRVGK